MHNNRIFDAGAAALGKALLENDSLEFLSLSSNGVGDEGACRAEAHTVHASSPIRMHPVWCLLSPTRKHCGARSSGTCCGTGAKGLADGLRGNRALRRLDLYFNKVLTYLLTCLLACLLACLLTYLLSYLLTCSISASTRCLLTCLLTCLLAYLLTCLLTD